MMDGSGDGRPCTSSNRTDNSHSHTNKKQFPVLRQRFVGDGKPREHGRLIYRSVIPHAACPDADRDQMLGKINEDPRWVGEWVDKKLVGGWRRCHDAHLLLYAGVSVVAHASHHSKLIHWQPCGTRNTYWAVIKKPKVRPYIHCV